MRFLYKVEFKEVKLIFEIVSQLAKPRPLIYLLWLTMEQ